MNYGYIRISTDKQTVENQRFEIKNFCRRREMKIDKWVEEIISSRKKLENREFFHLFNKLKSGDTLVVAELSRIGRNLLEVLSILNECLKREVKIFAIKENYELGDNINSKVLAFAFGLSAEIERQMISQRTKEALARRRAEGVILGRPKGRKSSYVKLTGKEQVIKVLLQEGKSYSAIARKLRVHRLTVSAFVNSNDCFDGLRRCARTVEAN